MKTSRKEFILKSFLATAGLSPGLAKLDALQTANLTSRPSLRNATGIKISVFSKHLQWLDYPEMAETASQMGFDGVDLTVRPGGHVLPERVTDDLPRAVEAVRKQGLEVYTMSTAITDAGDPLTEPILKTASDLGINHYRMGWFDYNEHISIPENLDRFEKKLRRVAKLNEQYDIHGDYQNHSGTSFGAAVWDIWISLHTIDSPWIGSQYDIRHATVEGAQSWPVGLKAMHPYIGTLDVKDFHWEQTDNTWQIKNVLLGQGMVDFNQYFKLLKEYEISVPITLHNEYDLGGAQHGNSSITIAAQQVTDALQSDLETLKKMLKEANLL